MDNTTIDKANQWYINTYAQFPIIITRGSKSIVFDDKDNAYIDFTSGIGVSSVGYGNEALINAIKNQAEKITHMSNLFYTEQGPELAEKICRLTKMNKVFFSNSGAEANEGAIKLARKYSFEKYGDNRNVIITLKQSFHGRTITTLAATGQDHFHQSFFPFTEGFKYVKANDIEDLALQVDDTVCGIMMESVQGEGGVHPLNQAFVKEVGRIAKEKDIAIIFDEVQCGVGRTGTFLGCDNYDIEPDIITLAKGLGGGVPIGAFLCNEKMSAVLKPGDHGSTYGGNPLVCAAANEVLNQVTQDGFLEKVKINGDKIVQTILGWKNPKVVEVRGKGLMIGVQLKADIDVKEIQKKALENGLLILSAGGNTIRLLPPLNITDNEIKIGLTILKDILRED
ncbi:MAG TPA: aspartate aminotransferase family protein [Epulopiscium sp.]|nr:aspartate aminotransferase family protein [Candidatus Epulonipiscium sp.]